MTNVFSSEEVQGLISEILLLHSRLPRIFQTTLEEHNKLFVENQKEQELLFCKWLRENVDFVSELSDSDMKGLICLRDNEGVFVIGGPQHGGKIHFTPFQK